MSTFNQENIKSFRKDFDLAVKHLQGQYGINISLGNISFNDMKFTTKLTVSKTGTNTSGKKLEQIEFERNCFFFGLEKEDFNKEFNDRGKVYKIVGIKPRSRKNPIVVEDINGKRYTANAPMIKEFLKNVSQPIVSTKQPIVKDIDFKNLALGYGLDETYYKAIYTGPSGGKYYLIGFDNGKGILQKIGTEDICKLDISKIKKSLIRPHTLTQTSIPTV